MPGKLTLGSHDTARPGPARARQPGWWIPWTFVGFFLLIIAVNGVMIYFAMSTWTGLETRNHWQKGVTYNAAIEGARAQEERGWQVAIDVQPIEGRKARLEIDMKDRYGNNLSNAAVTAQLIRPTSEGHDFTVVLPYHGNGRYGTEFEVPLPGQWDVRIVADHPAGDYQQVKRIVIKG